MRNVLIGQTDYTVLVRIASTTGAPVTGLTEASIDIAYVRVETDNDVATTDVTPVTLAALTTAHTDWGFLEVGSSDHPGLYRLDIADAVFASGAWEAVVTITDASGTDFYATDIGFRLVAFNAQDGVRLGLTALPSAAAEAAGGLYTRGTGAGQITQTVNGLIDINTVTEPVDVASMNAGAIDAASFSANSVTASALAADAVTEIQSGLATATALTVVDDFLDTEIAAIKAKTDNLPAAFPTNFAATVISAGGIVSADAVAISGDTTAADNAELAFDGTGFNVGAGQIVSASVTGSVGSVTGNVGGNVVGTVGAVAGDIQGDVLGTVAGEVTVGFVGSGGIDAASFAAGALNAVWSVATRTLTAGTNIVLVKGTGVTGFNDLSAAQVNTEADTALTDYGALKPTTAGRTLDVSVGGEAGLDWANIGSPDTVQVLSNTSISDITGDVTADLSPQAILDVNAQADLALADYDGPTNAEMNARTLVAASYATAANQTTILANIATVDDLLDTEVGTIITNLGVVDTVVDAIKLVTDKVDTTLVLDGAVYQFTANALELAPTGGAGDAPTLQEIVDALSQHTNLVVGNRITRYTMELDKGSAYVAGDNSISLVKASGETGWPTTVTTIDFSCWADDKLTAEYTTPAGLDDIALTSVTSTGGVLALSASQTNGLTATLKSGRYKFAFVANRATAAVNIRSGTLTVREGDGN